MTDREIYLEECLGRYHSLATAKLHKFLVIRARTQDARRGWIVFPPDPVDIVKT